MAKKTETPVINLPMKELESVESRSKTELALVEAKIKTPADLENATGVLRNISALITEIDSVFKPHIDAAKALAKNLKGSRDKYANPLEEAKESLRKAIGAWQQKELEKARIAAAKLTEKRIEKAEAKGIPLEEVEIAVPKEVAKGEVSYRTLYKFRVLDKALVPDQFWELNETGIGIEVRATKGKIVIPGIETYEELVPIEN